MNKLYCEKCDRLVEFKKIRKIESFQVFDEIIEIKSMIAICYHCENELFLEEYEVANQNKLFEIYMERNNISSINEFKRFEKNNLLLNFKE